MAEFRINVVIDPRRAASGGRRTRRELSSIENTARRVGRTIATAFAFTGLTVGIGQIVQLADEFTNIQNRIRVVTEDTAELTGVTAELFDIAQNTRSAFAATTEVYSRVSLAARDLGISQRETLDFTEALNQAVILSGASAQEAQAGLIQLSQGLASGALRGDELRSVLEQLPVVADVIADSLGKTRGELRELGAEGAITAEVVLNAFAEAREELEDRFGQTVPTISQAFTVLRNSLVSFFGELADSSGIATSFSQFVIDLASNIDDLSDALQGTLEPTQELSSGFQVFATTALLVIRVLSSLVDIVATNVTTAFSLAGDTIGGVAAGIAQFAQGNFSEAADVFENLGADLADTAFTSFTDLREQLINDTSQTIERIVELWDSSARDIGDAQAGAISGERGQRTAVSAGLTEEQQRILERQANFVVRLEDQEQDLIAQIAAIEAAQASLASGGTVEQALQAETDALQQAAAAQRLLRVEREAAQLGDAQFVALAVDIVNGINAETDALQRLREEQERAQGDAGVLEGLREELRLLQLTREERAVAQAVSQLSVDATQEQRAEVEQLAAEIFRLQEIERTQLAFFDEFVRGAARASRDALSGLLADPLADGLDELPGRFAGVLQELASQALASELFRIFSNLPGPLGRFFGLGIGLPGFQNGGSFRVGGSGGPDSQVVAFRASPMENVTITPPGQTAGSPVVNVPQQPPAQVVVVDSMEKARKFLNGPEGTNTVLRILRDNPDSVAQVTN